MEVGVGAVAVLGRIGGAAPGVHGSLAAVLVAGRGTGVKGAVVVEHWGRMRGAGTEKERDIQPTPLKSRRSITSACCEDFLALDLAMESSGSVERRGLEDGGDGEEERSKLIT